MNTPQISVAVLTHNETQEFKWLMRSLEAAKHLIDEIVIVDDYSSHEFVALVQAYKLTWPIKFFQRRLNKNFAAQRNFAKSKCSGRLILFPDADELPSQRILTGLPSLLSWMESESIDACYLPRLNVTLPGPMRDPLLLDWKTEPHTWEDQVRIIRNLPRLKWVKRVDEGLSGVEMVYKFPRTEEFALLHVKTSARCEQQQAFYRSMWMRSLTKHWNSIAKRTFRRERSRVVAVSPPL
jgi:glycosyltransferase involved in cell wall biosynthesis